MSANSSCLRVTNVECWVSSSATISCSSSLYCFGSFLAEMLPFVHPVDLLMAGQGSTAEDHLLSEEVSQKSEWFSWSQRSKNDNYRSEYVIGTRAPLASYVGWGQDKTDLDHTPRYDSSSWWMLMAMVTVAMACHEF